MLSVPPHMSEVRGAVTRWPGRCVWAAGGFLPAWLVLRERFSGSRDRSTGLFPSDTTTPRLLLRGTLRPRVKERRDSQGAWSPGGGAGGRADVILAPGGASTQTQSPPCRRHFGAARRWEEPGGWVCGLNP